MQCCHVLIFKCFLVLSHKDMHFIKLIKCSVVDMRDMILLVFFSF